MCASMKSEVKPFKHAGMIMLEEIVRSEGTTLTREGKGWKSVVHQMKKELPVSLKAIAKYVFGPGWLGKMRFQIRARES